MRRLIVACKPCNGEKRRDDQLPELTLAEGGWESFLSHDSTCCGATCSTCAYWRKVWPDSAERVQNAENARKKIGAFRARYPEFLDWSRRAKTCLRQSVDTLYRECQEFAATEIKRAVDEAFGQLTHDLGKGDAEQMTQKANAAGRDR